MVSQNHSITKNENDLEKQNKNEKSMRWIGLHGLSTMLLGNQTPFEITSTAGSNLIPRVMATNIIVYAINLDLHMTNNGGRHNIQHDIRSANNGATTNNMDLHTAATRGDIERARKVVHRHGELLRLEDPEGRNLPLHFAVMYGHKEVASYLVKKYPQGSYALNRSNVSPIYLAVVHHPTDLALVKDMLSQPITDRNAALEALKNGKSVVRAAIKDQNQEMLRTILKCQPDLIKFTDEEGLTPLSYAASNGFLDIIGYIIKKFPKSISWQDKDGSYPVHKACLGGHVEVLKMFHCKYPRWLLSSDKQGRNILHLAAKERDNKLKPVVSYLLTMLSIQERQKMINTKDENGCTPLHLAKRSKNREIEGLIIKHASINVV